MIYWTSMATFVNALGQELELRNRYHLTFDADGSPKIDRLVIRCWVKD